MDSILDSINKLLGVGNEEYFNPDIIMHINTVLNILCQMGVGPEEGFLVTDDSQTWSDFLSDNSMTEMVKIYVYLKVKSSFDPPMSSTASEAMNRQISELEWRLSIL